MEIRDRENIPAPVIQRKRGLEYIYEVLLR
jgi:hypothetical protein